MLKALLAGTAALVLASGSLAVAQSGPRTDMRRGQPTVEDIGAMVDAHVAFIRARLRLTAEQEKHWPAVEAALRELAKERAARISERRASRETAAGTSQPDVIARMRQNADTMLTRAGGQKKLADAAEPLYKSLDDNQKQRLAMLLRAPNQAPRGSWQGSGRRFSQGFDHGRHGHYGHHRGREAR